MAKYRKKPIIVEAVQLRWDTWFEMYDYANVGYLRDSRPEIKYLQPDGTLSDVWSERIALMIPTLEGLMIASQDDWVIRGVKGELYPCKPDIFAQTYEIAPAENPGLAGGS